jgi:hypothetical protein
MAQIRWRYANSQGKMSYGRWHEVAEANDKTLTTACGKTKPAASAEPISKAHREPTEAEMCKDCARLVAVSIGKWVGHEAHEDEAREIDPALASLPIPCACRQCRTPETETLVYQIEQARRAAAELNRLAFDLYCLDIDSGQPVKAPAEYREMAKEMR